MRIFRKAGNSETQQCIQLNKAERECGREERAKAGMLRYSVIEQQLISPFSLVVTTEEKAAVAIG